MTYHKHGSPENDYIRKHSVRLHPAQEKLIQVTQKLPNAGMLSAPEQIQLLANLCKTIGAKKTIEVGTFTGYGAMSLAMVLPEDGKVIACDINEEWANIGKPYWEEAGVAHKIDLRIGPAVETLKSLLEDGQAGTFDYVFIDCNKEDHATYYDLSKKLVRHGGIIAIDNVLWGGRVYDQDNIDEKTEHIRKLNKKIAEDHSVDISMVKIGDGTTIVFKR